MIIPFFAGSNLVAALSGIHRTPPRRLAVLLAVGIAGRLASIWWLAQIFDEQLETISSACCSEYSWWLVGMSVVLVVLSTCATTARLRRGT